MKNVPNDYERASMAMTEINGIASSYGVPLITARQAPPSAKSRAERQQFMESQARILIDKETPDEWVIEGWVNRG